MKFEDFAPIFGTLAIQLRERDADEGMARGYFAAMKDIEPEFVAMAADRFARGAALNGQGEAWFPKVPEWRAMARKIEGERRDEQCALIRKLRSRLCVACADTGWTYHADGRVSPCPCQQQRRLELLGRRPWPALLEAEPVPDGLERTIGPDAAVSLKAMIEHHTGRRILPRAMPETRQSRRARRDGEDARHAEDHR